MGTFQGRGKVTAANNKIDVCYNVQTAVNAKHKLVAEFEGINEGPDHNQFTPMVERTKTVVGTETLPAVVDAGYNSARDRAGNMAQGTVPHVAGPDFDVRVPMEKAEPVAIVLQKDGRCVYLAERNPDFRHKPRPIPATARLAAQTRPQTMRNHQRNAVRQRPPGREPPNTPQRGYIWNIAIKVIIDTT
jgi:hypothetical protein